MKRAHKNILSAIGVCASNAGVKAWVVGGFVRDYYLGRDTIDIDICVEGDASILAEFCAKEYGADIKRFPEFGTARVNIPGGLKLDFVRCRKEVYPAPAALPVVKPSVLHDDLFRRDFTANAWALSILPDEFFKSYDLFESRKAIDGKYIQVLHAKSFEDDPTRIFRALRFAGRFSWRIERSTEQLLKAAVKGGFINLLSRERVVNEFIKMLEEQAPLPILKMLDKYKISGFIFQKIKYPKNISLAPSLYGRIALLALGLKKDGSDFVKTLRLPHALQSSLLSLIGFYNSKYSPAADISPEDKKIIKLFNPAFPAWQFKKCFITGGEIKALGLDGKKIKELLLLVSEKQRAGIIKNKTSAIKFIKKEINK